jgi:hypothetical protein
MGVWNGMLIKVASCVSHSPGQRRPEDAAPVVAVVERDGDVDPALPASRLEEVHAVNANAILALISVRNVLREKRDDAMCRTLSTSTGPS